MFRRIVIASLCLIPLAVFAAAPVITDWGEALRKDAQAMHDDLAANHPGSVDPLNPGFATANDRGLALALDRAKKTHDYAGYYFAMRAYAASFNDGHLGFRVPDDTAAPPLPHRWPGFLTAFDRKGAQRVVTRSDDAPVPLGARLVSCDGRNADRLADDIVGSQTGRWQLRAIRIWRGGQLFLDNGNPWVERPVRCVFDVEGKERTVALDWRPLDEAAAKERLAATYHRRTDPIGMHTWPDGTVWITLSDFDGDPSGPAAKALEPLIARLAKERHAIVSAPRIVLDLRGNNGGSSDWSEQIGEIIWSEGRVQSLHRESIVDWRASTANIARIRGYADELRKAPGSSQQMLDWATSVSDGMTKAQAEGKPYWRMPHDGTPPPTLKSLPKPKARVFMVTDSGCASACLDAADLWLALGAVHVGEETGADTLYMDIRQATLPSGIGRIGAAMKVFRGRARGNNVSLVPAYPYDGDLTDTAALEHWIATLPR